MKKLCLLLCACLLTAGLPLAVGAATTEEREVVSYGLDVLASREEMVMAGLVGN